MGHVVGVGACGRGLGIYSMDEVMWICGKGWGHVAGWICDSMSNVKKSKMLTMNEVHKNSNLTQ